MARQTVQELKWSPQLLTDRRLDELLRNYEERLARYFLKPSWEEAFKILTIAEIMYYHYFRLLFLDEEAVKEFDTLFLEIRKELIKLRQQFTDDSTIVKLPYDPILSIRKLISEIMRALQIKARYFFHVVLTQSDLDSVLEVVKTYQQNAK